MEIKNFSYRPMYQKLMEASEVQDERIDEFAQAIQEHYQIRDEELGDPSVASPSEIVAVGRIVSDSLEGRLNAQSILLESSRMTGAGARTPLRLDAVPSYAFFPGQIVAVRGKNSSGNYFAVSEILRPPQLPVASSSLEDLTETAERLRAGPVSIFIASGPYTTEDNLLFESLDAICDKAAEQQPDVVILTGPFIDSDHPLVRDGDFDLETADPNEGGTLEDLFRERIARRIRRIANSLVILIPSLRDAVSKHLAFPQEGFRRKLLDLPPVSFPYPTRRLQSTNFIGRTPNACPTLPCSP
jgi:DNA polymerase alpha subunit B